MLELVFAACLINNTERCWQVTIPTEATIQPMCVMAGAQLFAKWRTDHPTLILKDGTTWSCRDSRSEDI